MEQNDRQTHDGQDEETEQMDRKKNNGNISLRTRSVQYIVPYQRKRGLKGANHDRTCIIT